MLELSLQPKDRHIALLKYSRPIGTDKRRRAFVVSRKVRHKTKIILHVARRVCASTFVCLWLQIANFTESERILREQQESDKLKEKKFLLRRRLRVGECASGRAIG